ncbi:FAD dependent oxidoreductase [Candidatus Vecturithrix granuli]|uniref:FAD dependent oxidoreductase n=1 Tax=Vecturithrix granuli TaxID=1499967 RepID=A0A081BYU3_VECG1|nr:FAD dependent oxidoreductase [Candidatus Vecturithrix granuli]
MEYDVIIIGAGITGSSIARQLCRYQLRVALLEKEADVSFGVSKSNSGIVHAGFHEKPGSLKGKLCARGNLLYEQYSQELNFPFRRSGILMVAMNDEQVQQIEAFYFQGVKNHVPYLQLISGERALEMEPNLTPDIREAIYAPTGGIVEPYEMIFAIVENAQKNGLELFTNTPVEAIEPVGGGLRVLSGSKEFTARFVVNAAGLYADMISQLAGAEEFTITPRKGEELLLDKRVGSIVKSVIFPVPTKTSKGILVIPTVEGTLMIGPTAVEIDDKEDRATTTAGMEQILEQVRQMVAGIQLKDIITQFVGLRPTIKGDDFYIARSQKVPTLIQVAGIQSPGLTAAPAIAEMVKDLLLKAGVQLVEDPDYDPYRPRKKKIRQLDLTELDALIEENPAYGSVVCRCEKVSEAEIVHAIRQGHTTIDAIKFATRTGMGRCQGGFCTYRVMEILRRETGMAFEQITKRGGQSYLVQGALSANIQEE